MAVTSGSEGLAVAGTVGGAAGAGPAGWCGWAAWAGAGAMSGRLSGEEVAAELQISQSRVSRMELGHAMLKKLCPNRGGYLRERHGMIGATMRFIDDAGIGPRRQRKHNDK
jgi:hypothetical protein